MKGIPEDFRTGLTFDDVLLVPRYSEIKSRKDVRTTTRLTSKITLDIPIVSANMDTVTESNMAIAIARLGGIGVIHRFLTVEDQVSEVAKVKRSEGILIEDPITITADRPLTEAIDLLKKHGIGGIVVVDGEKRIVGLLTRRDVILEDESDSNARVEEAMTPKRDLITAPPGISIDDAKAVLRKNKIEKLPVVDSRGVLVGLITSQDIEKRRRFPQATKDEKGKLRVAAAIGVRGDYMERAERLLEVGADALVIDIAHGHSASAIETLKSVRAGFKNSVIIAGNVATAEGTTDLISAGADAIKVGVGSGSICITRIVSGFGVPQLTAIMDSARAAAGTDVPVIADGGIRQPGDVTKALAAGASTVMIGSLFAGTEESPGATILRDGVRYKLTRGMASLSATIDRRLRETGTESARASQGLEDIIEETVPEGVEGMTPYKGRVEEVVHQLVGGVRSGMSYCGSRTIPELSQKALFMRITDSGLRESHPHDIERMR